MREKLLVMALVCACSAMFISCEKDGSSPSVSNASITCTPTVIKDDGNGKGDGNDYHVILQSKGSWSVSVDRTWATVSPTSGKGVTSITITVASGNTDSAHVTFSNASRSATVTVYRAINSIGGKHNNHDFVDLGLSVKWATMNVGATTVTEYGNHYAWGETSVKTNYSWSTYTYGNGDYDKMTKYCTSSGYGTVDNKKTLEAADDAARVYWGGNWRMPTYAEQVELKNNCTITWTANYHGTGVAGHIFTSNKTGYTDKSIFLPNAGYRDGTSLKYAGSYGHYWSSSLNESYSFRSQYLSFYSGSVSTYYDSRYYGHSVRAVCP